MLKQMDFLTQPVHRTSTCVLSDPVRLEQKPSLTDILNNIQTLRRFFYRPRPGQGRRTRGPSVEENQPFCGLSAGGAGVLSGEFMLSREADSWFLDWTLLSEDDDNEACLLLHLKSVTLTICVWFGPRSGVCAVGGVLQVGQVNRCNLSV